MTVVDAEHELPPGDYTFTIEAATHHAAAVLAMFGENYDLVGDVTLHVDAPGHYAVNGVLGKDGCGVWIERAETHEVLTQKIERASC